MTTYDEQDILNQLKALTLMAKKNNMVLAEQLETIENLTAEMEEVNNRVFQIDGIQDR